MLYYPPIPPKKRLCDADQSAGCFETDLKAAFILLMLSFSHETSIETFKSTEELLLTGLRRPVAPHAHLGFAHYVTGRRGNERGESKCGRPPQRRTTSKQRLRRNAAAGNNAANTNVRLRSPKQRCDWSPKASRVGGARCLGKPAGIDGLCRTFPEGPTTA